MGRLVVVRLLVLLVAMQFGAGCSFVFIEKAPPPAKRGPYFYCHKSMAIPFADGFVASMFVLNGVVALSKDSSDYAGETLSQASDVAINLLLATIWAVSAGSGVTWVDECRVASEAIRVGVPGVAAPKPVLDPGPIVAPID